MKEIKPFDIEELRRNPWKPDPYQIAKVLSELLSRHYGYPVELVLTPKAPKLQEDSYGKQIPPVDKP